MQSGTVSIRGITWEVEIAETVDEIQQGLSGRTSLEAGHGMLFDLESEYSQIEIEMGSMLFNLDIVFIGEDLTVRAMAWGQDPSANFTADFGTGLGARYFLEVNAGEIGTPDEDGVTFGDPVVIENYTPVDDNIPGLVEQMLVMLMLVMLMGMMMEIMEGM